MDKPIYRCSCGYVTHFEKALEAHCRFRHHEPLNEKPAVEEKTAVKKTVKTRKPRAKESAVRSRK